MTKIVLDGRDYPVSKQFYEKTIAVLGTMDFSVKEVAHHTSSLMSSSNRRYLSDDERLKLDYLTHVLNVANTIKVIGAHHSPAEWGLDGWDAVHGNSVHKDCGCVEHYVFDHHSVTNHFGHDRVNTKYRHHYIEPLRVCKAHK